jgi:FkbM family methyltransferase
MRTASLSGKLIQLSELPFPQWGAFIQGWLQRGRSGTVPCVFPASRRLVYVPLDEFYESYWFFSECDQGRAELSYLLDRLRPGDVLFDIGAFRGAYGAAAKAMLGDEIEVHLFEPLAENLKRIAAISELNHFRGFEVVGKAVGSGAPIVGAVDSGDQMLRQGSGSSATTEFLSTSVDAYVAATGIRPTVMKIDVEGFEADLLEGARQYLSEHRPRLWIEVHPSYLAAQGRTWETLGESLEALGYQQTLFDDYHLPRREKSYHVWCEASSL